MCISLSVFPGFHGSAGIFHSSPMMNGGFPYVPSQGKDNGKSMGFVCLCMCYRMDFGKGSLAVFCHSPLVSSADFIVPVPQHPESRRTFC